MQAAKPRANSKSTLGRFFDAADRSQMMQSPAYAALSPAGRKVLAAIEHEVSSVVVAVSRSV